MWAVFGMDFAPGSVAKDNTLRGCVIMRLSAYIGTRDNNFNLLRFLAATAVVVTHANPVVLGIDAIEPLQVETGYTLGHLAVNVFFIISGFLIAKSLLSDNDIFDFVAARGLRLIPGLLMATIVTAFVIGPMVTTVTMGAYFTDWRTWLYVPLTAGLVLDNLGLYGVFATVPSQSEINTPLWTLRWEAMAYVGLAIVSLLGLLASRWKFALVAVGFLGVYGAVTGLTDLREQFGAIDHLARFGLCFLVGAAFYVYRDAIPVSILLVVSLWIAVYFASATPAYQALLVVAMAYTIFWLAFVPSGFIRDFNLLGDASYGIYIYGFLIQQTAIFLMPSLTPLGLFIVVLPIVLTIAYLSFYLVEKPVLSQRYKLSAWLRWRILAIAKHRQSVTAGTQATPIV